MSDQQPYVSVPPAGWYRDPAQSTVAHEWDGRSWTGRTGHGSHEPATWTAGAPDSGATRFRQWLSNRGAAFTVGVVAVIASVPVWGLLSLLPAEVTVLGSTVSCGPSITAITIAEYPDVAMQKMCFAAAFGRLSTATVAAGLVLLAGIATIVAGATTLETPRP